MLSVAAPLGIESLLKDRDCDFEPFPLTSKVSVLSLLPCLISRLFKVSLLDLFILSDLFVYFPYHIDSNIDERVKIGNKGVIAR